MGGWWVSGWVGEKKTKLMLYSTQVEVEVGVDLGNNTKKNNVLKIINKVKQKQNLMNSFTTMRMMITYNNINNNENRQNRQNTNNN